MCIGYIILNKACLNDNYLLYQINQLVNVILGHELLTIMDAFTI